MASVNNVPKDLQDCIRDYLGRRVKLYIKRMVKQEIRPDKWENRVVAFSGSRLFVFSSKPSKSPQEHNICYLDIQCIESSQPNRFLITTYEGKTYSFVTLEAETDEVNHMITHIGTSIKQIFPSFPLERIIKKIDVQPPDRLKMMNDMIKTIDTKEHGPCGNFAMMYACMCDYYNLPYREEVAWDVDTIYLSQDCRTLTLKDFDHLSGKDLQPIVASIEHNSWFTALDLRDVKMTQETQGEIHKIMQKNCLIEDINLSNTGVTVEFVTKLGLAILSNSGSQLTRIDLSKNVLDDRALISFLGSLNNLSRGITHLNLSNTKLTGKGVNKIFEIMIQHESIFSGLQVLNFSDNPTKGEDLQQMYKFLASPNGITHLDLSGTECALENLMVALQRGCTSIKHLYLGRNVFTYKKMKEIVVQPSWKQFFASNCTLELIDLSCCKLPVDALKELLLGISSNMHLKDLQLNIAGNDFQQAGSLNIESTIANIHNISSLDISNNNLDQGLATLLPWVKTNKSLRHLAIGRNFDHVKPKQLPNVLEGVVQLIQDEDCDLESLSLADSRLKQHISVVINALGSNGSLTELDISGNYMTDFGARMLSKALQINNKLKTIIWDKNAITCQGFEDIAQALEKNYSMKKMPTPVNDVAIAQQKNPERTEAAIQKIEVLLQRNHSPQKYLANRDFKIQGCYLSSTQQMVDRLVVQVQDTVNALQLTPSADEYKDDIEVASGFVKDANNSQLLLPQLQDIADKSVGDDTPVHKRLKEISQDLKNVLDTQMKKTVTEMLQCTTKQLSAISQDKEFSTELNSGCLAKSSLPEDFATHTLNVVEMDIFNKLSELNLAVASHISDRVIDAVIENLSTSHRKLTNHLNVEKSKQGKPMKSKETTKETEKGDTPEKASMEELKPPGSGDSSPAKTVKNSGDTPNITSKRKTLNDRRKRPPTVIDAEHVQKALDVYNSINPSTKPSPLTQEANPRPCPGIKVKVMPTPPKSNDVSMTTLRESEELKKEDIKKVGSQEDLTAVTELNEVPKVIEPAKKPVEIITSIPDLDTVAPLVHLGKDRPKRVRNHRPARPTTPAANVRDSNSTEEDNNIDNFFKSTSQQVAAPVITPSKGDNGKEKEKDKKVSRKPSTDGKGDAVKPPVTKTKDKPKLGMLGRLGFGKGKKEAAKKEEDEVDSEPVQPKKEETSTPDKENTEPEKKEEAQPPEKEEPKAEVQPEPEKEKEEVKEVKEPKKALRPPMGGMGFSGEMMNQLKLRQQNRKSGGKILDDTPPKEKEKEKEAVKPAKTETPEKPVLTKPNNAATASSPKTADSTDAKPSPDKTQKTVLQLVHDQNRPKPLPRPKHANRSSTASRDSTVGEDGDVKEVPKPAPKPRPAPPPKPRSSIKSDDLSDITSSEEKSDSSRSSNGSRQLAADSTEKSASLPRNVPPVTEKERSSRPASMFVRPEKEEKDLGKKLTSSKSSGDLTETEDLVKDLKEVVEDKTEDKNNDEKEDVDSKSDEKKEDKNVEKPEGNEKPKENSEEANSEDKTDFEDDVIMV